MSGLIISAPSSGSGKTTITLGLLRALRDRGVSMRSAKSGPDYIDPQFHTAASGKKCLNLDAWAMKLTHLRTLASGSDPLLIEGAMGLFDGAPPVGKGATADLAFALGLPVVMVVDVGKQAQSVAALVGGFAQHAPHRAPIKGLILNNVGSPRHEKMLRTALDPLNIPILGCVARDAKLATPSRHLGLVQASERDDLEAFLTYAGDVMAKNINLDAVLDLFAPLSKPTHPATHPATPLAPPAQSIAIARDAAFGFCYPHLLDAWHAAGASLSFFAPLDDQAPDAADLVYLPGGYPELHAGRLAANQNFITGMHKARSVYGECGGYMTMGRSLIDAQGVRHKMLGLLDLETSFQTRKLHLGYRTLIPQGGAFADPLTAHEFHYATTLTAKGTPLFRATDAEGTQLPDMGLINGAYSGSFAHIIDRA